MPGQNNQSEFSLNLNNSKETQAVYKKFQQVTKVFSLQKVLRIKYPMPKEAKYHCKDLNTWIVRYERTMKFILQLKRSLAEENKWEITGIKHLYTSPYWDKGDVILDLTF